jgi:hypothetical protein
MGNPAPSTRRPASSPVGAVTTNVHEVGGSAASSTATRRSPVVARFEIVSDLPAAGEAYQRTVTVQRNGRVRSVVTCVGREETVQEWAADQPPTLEELADLLVSACYDDYHESRIRLLSAVVHGLLPQGNHLWEATAGIPDAVLDASLGFGHRTTYRAEIQNALADALRGRPGTAWALQLQTDGTDAHEEFVGQINEASTGDPEWLRRSTEASASRTGTPFDDLVAEAAYDEPAASVTMYWDSLYAGTFSLVPEGWEAENVAPLHQVAAAATWGEVTAVEKPYWLERLLETHIEDRADEGIEITDATPFRAADLRMDSSGLLDHMLAPWDLESLREWFPDEDMGIIEAHCRTGVASPGGHIDVYAPRDEQALLAALRSRGHNVVQRDFLSALDRALDGLSDRGPDPLPSKPTPTVFEQEGDTVVVLIDGDEVEWGDYVDALHGSLLLGFWNENGWGAGSDEVYLVAPGVVVESHVCDDSREQTLHENAADPAGIALDLLNSSEMTVALAVDIYGPLFDGNTALSYPLLPMTSWEASPFAEGTNGEENPGLHWGSCTGASEDVRAEFCRRVDAGHYPLVTELRKAGSSAWRAWVIGLLSAVPLSDQVSADGYPLAGDQDRLAGLSTDDLMKTAARILGPQ